MPSEDTAKRIREGRQKRVDCLRQLQQLKSAYDAEMRWRKEATRASSGLVAYLPNIIILLVSVSFPLSEVGVDWVLVGLLCLFNSLWGLLVRRPSHWTHTFLLLSCNLCVVHSAPLMYQSLTLPPAAPSLPLAFFVGFNALYALFMYHGYVERRFWFKMDYNATLAPFLKGCSSSVALDEEEVTALLSFAIGQKRSDRLDKGLSTLILANAVILLCVGVISPGGVIRSLRGVLHIFV